MSGVYSPPLTLLPTKRVGLCRTLSRTYQLGFLLGNRSLTLLGPAPEGTHTLTELFLAILFYLASDWCLGFHMIQFWPIRPMGSLLGVPRKFSLVKKGEENGENILPAWDTVV